MFALSAIIHRTDLMAQSTCDCGLYREWKSRETTGPRNADQELLFSLSRSPELFCRASAYWLKGNLFLEEDQLDSAEQSLMQALALFRRTACGDSVLLETNKGLAQVYYQRGDFARAQEYSFQLLKSAIAAGSVYEEANGYTMIAQVFNQTRQAEKGIEYARKAIPLVARIGAVSKKLDILFKLSKRYLWHFQDTRAAKSLDSSREFSLLQLRLARETGARLPMAMAYNNLQGIEWEKENFAGALRFLDSAFHYTDTADLGTMATNYYDKADLYRQMKQYDAAKRMADSALMIHRRMNNAAYIAEVYQLYSLIEKERGDYKAAFEANEVFRSINDSIRTGEQARQVAELEKKYNQAKNEQTIRELAQQKQIYLLFAVAGLLVAVVIGFYLRQQALRHRQKILETEQRLNRARINPHFFFNALASLQRFALEENDGKTLASNLSKFSRIMRESLESTYKEYVTVEQEIDFLTEYLKLQQLRFPGKFVFGIEASTGLETDEMLIPSMIIQPFVENSIEHGFSGINYAGSITVQFSVQDKELMVQVQDNGKGLTPSVAEADHVSRASQIIRDRIYLLNLKLKTRAGFSIDNTAGKPGVTVKIHLPLLRKHEIAADR